MGAMMLWIYFHRSKNYLTLDPGQLRPRMVQWKRILGVGLPAGGEFAIIFIYMGVIYYVLRDFGAAAQAGFGIGTRVLGLIQVPAMAIAFAAGPIVGQNFGAGLNPRVRETFVKVALLGAALMLATTVFTQWQPELLLRAFTSDRDTVAVGAEFLKHGLAEPDRAGIDFPVFEYFSGPRPHHAATDQFDRAAGHLCDPGVVAVGAAGIPHRAYLVPVDRDHEPAGPVEPCGCCGSSFASGSCQ